MQYGELVALANITAVLGREDASAVYTKRARELQARVLQLLWDPTIEYLGTYKTPFPPQFADNDTRWAEQPHDCNQPWRPCSVQCAVVASDSAKSSGDFPNHDPTASVRQVAKAFVYQSNAVLHMARASMV